VTFTDETQSYGRWGKTLGKGTWVGGKANSLMLPGTLAVGTYSFKASYDGGAKIRGSWSSLKLVVIKVTPLV